MSSTKARKRGARRLRGWASSTAEFGDDAPGALRQHQDAVAHQHRLLDVVGHHQDRADRQLALVPELDQIGAQRLRRQHVQRREGLVHQQHGGIDHQGAGQADALAHAAGELPRIGGFEAVEADQIDGRQRALAHLALRHALGLEPGLHILQHRQPGEEGEGLEDHGDALGRTFDRLAEIDHLAGAGMGEPGDDAQQGRFPAAGAAEQAHDLMLAQRHVDLVDDDALGARGPREGLAHIAHLDQGLSGGHGGTPSLAQSNRKRRSAMP